MNTLSKLAISLISALVITACSDSAQQLTPLQNDSVILAFGDSLTFGTGADSETQSYPARLAQLTGLKIVNEGIPGEISSEALARLASVLQQHKPQLVILCHGGNDLIQSLGLEQLEQNLEQMIVLIKQSGAEVVLIAVPHFNLMLTVPELYQQLAKKHQLAIELQVMRQIEADITMKSDMIHPNAKGYAVLAEKIQLLLQTNGAL